MAVPRPPARALLRTVKAFLVPVYLLSILVAVPVAFRIGGSDCGLAFTETLFLLYFLSTTLQLIASASKNFFLINVANLLLNAQHLAIASILQLFLAAYTTNSNGGDSSLPSSQQLVPKALIAAVPPWRLALAYSTPLFTLLEGFFTILAIQTLGETYAWLRTRPRGAALWVIAALLASAGTITAALFYLHRIYVSPLWNMSIGAASLLGVALTAVAGVGLYGIVGGRGSVVESSLFFAYIVRCIYEFSPALASSTTQEFLDTLRDAWQAQAAEAVVVGNTFWKRTFAPLLANRPPFPNPSSAPAWRHTLRATRSLALALPRSLREICSVTWQSATDSVSPTVVLNLCYRLMIFYSATRIIPAIQATSHASTATVNPPHSSSRWRAILYAYSPCILIAMYTHLILQYSGELERELRIWGARWLVPGRTTEGPLVVDAWSFWSWCNVFGTILIYATELLGT